MKYSKKSKQKNDNDKIINNLYLFTEISKSNIRKDNVYHKYKNNAKKIYFSNKNIINHTFSNEESNLADENNKSNLLKEISELRFKINKYKNELERAKREKNIQKIYINSLEQKYISQLISNKENINYEQLKNDNLFKTNKKPLPNIINDGYKKNNQNNKSNINFKYNGIRNNCRKKQNKQLNANKYNFSYRNYKQYFTIN